jgi:nucleoside-diphosphate-sugar epimerase
MKIFVTGGGGFLGFAIVQQLRANGHAVVSFSRKNYPALNQFGVTHFQGDISEYKVLKESMAGC